MVRAVAQDMVYQAGDESVPRVDRPAPVGWHAMVLAVDVLEECRSKPRAHRRSCWQAGTMWARIELEMGKWTRPSNPCDARQLK